MTTKQAIEWAKMCYPDVKEITQLQLANAYMSGIIKGSNDAQERALGIVNNVDNKPLGENPYMHEGL